jgi:signal transduction histidine kinase
LVLKPQQVEIRDLLDGVQRQVGRVAEEQGLHVVVTGVSSVALADPTRLRQVLLILLDNALRHTPRGGTIYLAVSPFRTGPSRHPDKVRITVADTGEGIPPEHLQRIFERFYQVQNARSVRSSGFGGVSSMVSGTGTGLGLAIAKGLVEAQHGQIALESEFGSGTKVTLTLPAYTN